MAQDEKQASLAAESVEGIFRVREAKTFADGLHEGRVVDVEFRHDPYEYTDFVLDCEGFKLKVGYPSVVTPDSKLGKLLERFGLPVKVGELVDVKLLVGRDCVFQTSSEEGKKGKSYARVLDTTLKPAPVKTL